MSAHNPFGDDTEDFTGGLGPITEADAEDTRKPLTAGMYEVTIDEQYQDVSSNGNAMKVVKLTFTGRMLRGKEFVDAGLDYDPVRKYYIVLTEKTKWRLAQYYKALDMPKNADGAYIAPDHACVGRQAIAVVTKSTYLGLPSDSVARIERHPEGAGGF